MPRKRFSDYPPGVRVLIIVAGVVQIALYVAAQVDISRRPASRIRGGSKLGWRLVSLLNTIGPLAYFGWGRLPARDDR